MDEITLKDYRCFHERQTARLAPLTLLVGENSTGKTSFMALVRALWDVASGLRSPDFKEAPYDLGSFDEIAHYRGASGGRSEIFEAGFDVISRNPTDDQDSDETYRLRIAFGKKGTIPVPVRGIKSLGDTLIDEQFEADHRVLRLETCRGTWNVIVPSKISARLDLDENPWISLFSTFQHLDDLLEDEKRIPPAFTMEDARVLSELARYGAETGSRRPFASAPVRSKPRRTYDPARITPDPEGGSLPMYLASMYFHDELQWAALRKGLEGFGKASGLFEEVTIRPLGKRDSDPFQVQVRKSGGRRKGPWRNLIDVGYGVSQALPVITELLRSDAPQMFLLQQPEVHLHPSAQAALGSLFCQVASWKRQLIIETHSDHLIDRVRMDVRDGESALKPDDVSILYFERDGLDVRIHSLYIDEDGNMNAPEATVASSWKRRQGRWVSSGCAPS